MDRIVLISITEEGDRILKNIESCGEFEYVLFPSDLAGKIKLSAIVEKQFSKVDAIIFVASLGICVRVTAPFLKSKKTDPAVVCIPNNGAYVISVTGGHLGGANELTKKIAGWIDAVPIITTATDLIGIKAPDIVAKENNLIIDSMVGCKKIAALLVAKKQVALIDTRGIILEDSYLNYNSQSNYDGLVTVGNSINTEYNSDIQLNLIRKDIVLGVGCRKGFDPAVMLNRVKSKLLDSGIDFRAVAVIATIDIKENEPAVIRLAKEMDAKMKIFTKNDIEKIEHNFETSEFVKKTIGVGCVAEPCVSLCNAELIVNKMKLDGMTLAIGELEIDK